MTSLTPMIQHLLPDTDDSMSGFARVFHHPPSYAYLCREMGISEKDIQATIYPRIGMRRASPIGWLGFKVPMKSMDFPYARFCIRCLDANGYGLKLWDHRASLACPDHQIKLLTHCPSCKRRLSHNRWPYDCICGQRITFTFVTVSKPEAELMLNIVKKGDQNLLDLLDVIFDQTEMWVQWGILNPDRRLPVLLGLFEGTFQPGMLDNAPHRMAKEIHPRALYCLLLGAPNKRFRAHGQKLLECADQRIRAFIPKALILPKEYIEGVLGTRRISLKKFIQDGHIPEAMERTGIPLSEVNRLLLELEHEPFDPEQGIKATLLRSKRPPASLSKVVTSIKAGEIESLGYDARQGLEALRIEPFSYPKASVPTEAYTIQTLSKYWGVNQASIYFLIQSGFLEAERGNGQFGKNWLIRQIDVQAFEAEFLFASMLGRSARLSAHKVMALARTHQVEPVSGPTVDGGPTFLFLQSDITASFKSLLRKHAYEP